MAPIIAPTASYDEDLNISVDEIFAPKEKLGGHDRTAFLVATDGRDDECDNNAAHPEEDADHVILNQHEAAESNDGRRQSSNLFADEKDFNNELSSIHASYLGNDKRFAVEPFPQCATDGPLSLMQSFSPSSCSSGGGGLEDVDIGSTQLFDVDKYVDDFATGILSQIDADEELARQLQDEEDKKKQQKTKPKANVRPSIIESFLGEPFPMEVKSNYAKVSDNGSSSSAGGDFSDTVSGSLSMLTTSFKKWGNDISTAATDFFGEDIGLQRGDARSQYRNAV